MSASCPAWPLPAAPFEPDASLCAQLLKMARHLSRGRFDPEDLVQEVLTAALARSRAGAPPPRRGFELLLFVSLKNALLSRLRRWQVRERAERDLSTEEPAVDGPDEVVELPAWRTITDAELDVAIRSLSRRQREVFLAISGGERYAPVAARLRISEGAVAKRVFDARRRLRRRLLKHG